MIGLGRLGFAEEAVGTGFDGFDHQVVDIHRRHRDDFRRIRHRHQCPCCVEPANTSHHQVHQHDVRARGLHSRGDLVAVGP